MASPAKRTRMEGPELLPLPPTAEPALLVLFHQVMEDSCRQSGTDFSAMRLTSDPEAISNMLTMHKGHKQDEFVLKLYERLPDPVKGALDLPEDFSEKTLTVQGNLIREKLVAVDPELLGLVTDLDFRGLYLWKLDLSLLTLFPNLEVVDLRDNTIIDLDPLFIQLSLLRPGEAKLPTIMTLIQALKIDPKNEANPKSYKILLDCLKSLHHAFWDETSFCFSLAHLKKILRVTKEKALVPLKSDPIEKPIGFTNCYANCQTITSLQLAILLDLPIVDYEFDQLRALYSHASKKETPLPEGIANYWRKRLDDEAHLDEPVQDVMHMGTLFNKLLGGVDRTRLEKPIHLVNPLLVTAEFKAKNMKLASIFQPPGHLFTEIKHGDLWYRCNDHLLERIKAPSEGPDLPTLFHIYVPRGAA